MPKLSREQIAMYARSAGLSGGAVDIAVAVALAESGGRTDAHNPIPPDDSYGLWQINMLGSLGPDRRRKLGISSNRQLFDPAVNARAMAMISSGGSNWKPWSTYTNGAYRRHMTGGSGGSGTATPAGEWYDFLVPEPETWPGADTLGDIAGGIGSMAELAVGAGAWLSTAHNWVRIAQVVIGGGLVYVGLAITVRGALKPVQADVQRAVSVLPVGKAAGGAKKTAAAKPAPTKATTG